VGHGNRLVPFRRILLCFPLFPTREHGDESLEDTMMNVAAAGRRNDVRPCMLVLPGSADPSDSHARPYEGEEGEAVPATILVTGELPDGDWSF
jgi:hypothetical protein